MTGGSMYYPWGFKGHQQEFKEVFRQASGEAVEHKPKEGEETLEDKARQVVTEFFIQTSAEEFLKAAEEIMDDYTEDVSEILGSRISNLEKISQFLRRPWA